MTTLVRLDDEIVATVGATRFHLVPQIEALPFRSRRRRIAILMCAYALEIEAGDAPGPYCDDRAFSIAVEALAELEAGL